MENNRQALTGFREMAYSELVVPVEELKGEIKFTCTAVLEDHTENASVAITAYCKPQVLFHTHLL